jgi:hypothetical protein
MRWEFLRTRTGRIAAFGLTASVLTLVGVSSTAVADPSVVASFAQVGAADPQSDDALARVGKSRRTAFASVGESPTTPLGRVAVLAAASDLCAQVGSRAGFRGGALVTAVAVALAESGCNPGAAGRNGPTSGCPNGSLDRGLWQINDCYHRDVTDACAYDAQCNANAAYRISSQGTNWNPWTTFRTGAYRAHIAEAQAAVGRLQPVREGWGLHNFNAAGGVEHRFTWDVPDGCSPVTGDWNGNGTDTVGAVCRNGAAFAWAMLNGHSGSSGGPLFNWGSSGCLPLVGDWDANGTDTPGTVCARSNGEWRWALHNYNKPGAVEYDFGWGSTNGCWPIVGDWNGDRRDTPGLVCPQAGGAWRWALHDYNRAGAVEHSFSWGNTACGPMVGDWDGNRTDTPGTVCAKPNGERQWGLHNHNKAGAVEHDFGWGSNGQRPIVGDWNGDRTVTPGTTTLGA